MKARDRSGIARVISKTSLRSRILGVIAVIVLVIAVLAGFTALVIGAGREAFWLIAVVKHVPYQSLWRSLADTVLEIVSTADPSGQRKFAAERIGILEAALTLVATSLLWYATSTLSRAASRQAAADAPLLRVALYDYCRDGQSRLSLPSGATTSHDAYVNAFAKSESQMGGDGRQARRTTASRYIVFHIMNVQSKPYAVARDIALFASLTTYVKNDAKAEGVTFMEFKESALADARDDAPFKIDETIKRSFRFPILAPGEQATKVMFDVGGLSNVVIKVEAVEYRDLRGEKLRTAAFGQLEVWVQDDGVIVDTLGYSSPQRWEMP